MSTSPDAELLSYFKYDHLPERLQEISKPFFEIASNVIFRIPACHQRTQALQKLLEAKDCAVRAKLNEGSS